VDDPDGAADGGEDVRDRGGGDAGGGVARDDCLKLWSALTGKAIEILRQRAQLIYHFHKEGWDIHALGNGHSYYYLRIAYGQMLPELFTAIPDPALLDRASKLTIPDQGRVVNNERVSVLLNFKDDGQPYFQEMNLQSLAPKHASVVFHGGKICTKEEQIAYMRSKMKPPAEPKLGKLTPDTKRKGAVSKVGNVTIFYSLAQLEAAITAIRGSR
jgi:hypothetical protein